MWSNPRWWVTRLIICYKPLSIIQLLTIWLGLRKWLTRLLTIWIMTSVTISSLPITLRNRDSSLNLLSKIWIRRFSFRWTPSWISIDLKSRSLPTIYCTRCIKTSGWPSWTIGIRNPWISWEKWEKKWAIMLILYGTRSLTLRSRLIT